MYVTATQYLGLNKNGGFDKIDSANSYMKPDYQVSRGCNVAPFTGQPSLPRQVENYIPSNKSVNDFVPDMKHKDDSSTSDPKVWGPSYWFSLHVSAVHYPVNPSPIVRDRMKQRILAIPYEISCATCRPHAIAFIESNRDKLDKIVSNKHDLGKFYVDFHNKVNKRLGKPEWTYDQAYKVYSGQGN